MSQGGIFVEPQQPAQATHAVRSSLDNSIEPCGMREEAHHSIVPWWLLWEWATGERILREDEMR